VDNRPIGVFDSGFGGLSVLQSLVAEFPNEQFIYLGDTARIPYGVKSPATVAKYLKQNLEFLMTLKCKTVVVACNTASAVLKSETFAIPVIGVIEPGAEAAVATTQNKSIGVIATKGTVNSKAYVTAIHTLDTSITVHQNAGPLLVPLVEENWVDDPITNLIIYRYVAPLLSKGIDTLVLGCTHYPFLLPAIEKVTTGKVNIVRSGPAVAQSLRQTLAGADAAAGASQKPAPTRLLTTDDSSTYIEMARRLTVGLDLAKPELVEII
jgi:glutamate racemase